MTRSRQTNLPGLAMRCTLVAPSDVCPLMERTFAGPGALVRGVRTICFIPSSRQQPIFSPLNAPPAKLRAVWSVNAKTQAAAGCFWTVPTPARDGGAAWLTAAIEIRPGNTTGARPVDLAVKIIRLGRDRVVRVPENWVALLGVIIGAIVTSIGLYLGPKFTIRRALEQFRSQKLWEKKVETYTMALEVLHTMKWNSNQDLNQEASGEQAATQVAYSRCNSN